MRLGSRVLSTLAGVVAIAILAGCAPAATTGSSAPSPESSSNGPSIAPATTAAPVSNVTLTLYNAQHEAMVKDMVAAFTRETGIKVDIRPGKDFDIANQIVQEGASSPADVFFTENSPAMQLVSSKGLFAPVDAETLTQVPARYSPSTRDWIGVAARSTVLVYNPRLLSQSALPKSIAELANPEWAGKVGISPAGADFQAIVSAYVTLNGAPAGATWLKGLKQNGKIYTGNGAILRAVNAGEIPAGVIYHYYWFEDRAEAGANSSNTELYFFPNQDAGAFLSVSGLGALKSSKHPREAQLLLKFFTGKGGQQALATSKSLEYTLGSNVPANPKLKPFIELNPPEIDIAKLNGPQIVEMLQQAGLL